MQIRIWDNQANMPGKAKLILMSKANNDRLKKMSVVWPSFGEKKTSSETCKCKTGETASSV